MYIKICNPGLCFKFNAKTGEPMKAKTMKMASKAKKMVAKEVVKGAAKVVAKKKMAKKGGY